MFSDGMGLCAPAVLEGEMCRPERCEESLLCVGPSDDMAFCRSQCMVAADCDPTETCTPVGMGRMACIPNP
jgi:hypothetical protein